MSEMLNEKPNAEEIPRASSAAVIIEGHYAPPPQDDDAREWIRTSALIQASPNELYELWRDVARIPEWQEQIVSVTAKEHKHSHWVMQSGDSTIEWESEMLADEPGKRIAWRSIGGDSSNAGEVIFEEAPGGRGTLVTCLQEFRMSKVANAKETLVGRNPKQAVIENLRHFKALAETGEIPRTEAQPHGDRGLIGTVKR
jgi:uncharacterized membrane protein